MAIQIVSKPEAPSQSFGSSPSKGQGLGFRVLVQGDFIHYRDNRSCYMFLKGGYKYPSCYSYYSNV